MSVGEDIIQGLNEAVEWTEGKKELRTTRIMPVKSFSAQQIRNIRRKTKLSQSLFGGLLGVSTKAVISWESGKRKPNGPSSRLLELADNNDQNLLKMC